MNKLIKKEDFDFRTMVGQEEMAHMEFAADRHDDCRKGFSFSAKRRIEGMEIMEKLGCFKMDEALY